jgi:hypothetical protein
VWVRWPMKPWRDADGRIRGVLLFQELMTHQIEMRHALCHSEARFRTTFENPEKRCAAFSAIRLKNFLLDHFRQSPTRTILRANSLFLSNCATARLTATAWKDANVRKDGTICRIRSTCPSGNVPERAADRLPIGTSSHRARRVSPTKCGATLGRSRRHRRRRLCFDDQVERTQRTARPPGRRGCTAVTGW